MKNIVYRKEAKKKNTGNCCPTIGHDSLNVANPPFDFFLCGLSINLDVSTEFFLYLPNSQWWAKLVSPPIFEETKTSVCISRNFAGIKTRTWLSLGWLGNIIAILIEITNNYIILEVFWKWRFLLWWNILSSAPLQNHIWKIWTKDCPHWCLVIKIHRCEMGKVKKEEDHFMVAPGIW